MFEKRAVTLCNSKPTEAIIHNEDFVLVTSAILYRNPSSMLIGQYYIVVAAIMPLFC